MCYKDNVFDNLKFSCLVVFEIIGNEYIFESW